MPGENAKGEKVFIRLPPDVCELVRVSLLHVCTEEAVRHNRESSYLHQIARRLRRTQIGEGVTSSPPCHDIGSNSSRGHSLAPLTTLVQYLAGGVTSFPP